MHKLTGNNTQRHSNPYTPSIFSLNHIFSVSSVAVRKDEDLPNLQEPEWNEED